MYILILTIALNRTVPVAMTSAEFSSRETCEDAAAEWKRQSKLIFGNTLVTSVCKPK